MNKVAGACVHVALAALVACGGAEAGVGPSPGASAGPAPDASVAPAPQDAGADRADAAQAQEDTRTISPTELAIENPFMPGNQNGAYQAKVDESTRVDGLATMLLTAGTDVTASSWAATTTIIPVTPSQIGKRYRLRAKLKTAGARAAFAWFRIDIPGGQVIDNMFQPINRSFQGDNDFTEVALVLDVPPKAIRFAFGSGLAGDGRVWIGPMTLEAVGKSVPTTGE